MRKLIEIGGDEYQDQLDVLKRRPEYRRFVQNNQAQIAALVTAGAINPANESDFSSVSECFDCCDGDLNEIFKQ